MHANTCFLKYDNISINSIARSPFYNTKNIINIDNTISQKHMTVLNHSNPSITITKINNLLSMINKTSFVNNIQFACSIFDEYNMLLNSIIFPNDL